MKHIREQQGLSSGHWLLELHVVVAKAVADRARRAVTKRTIVSDYVREWGESNNQANGMYKKRVNRRKKATDKRANCGIRN